MAMVIIKRGKSVYKVSRKTYESQFKEKGFEIVEQETSENEDDVMEEQKEREIEEVEKEQEELEKVPISEMNKEQLIEYAEKHNIDTSNAKNVREARQIIQKAVRESKM